ncbi:MAG: hypothetical protein D6812_08405 [Deltaproteobacteria bacterium]|nr:MAG: hypothetical protein D6812_08405 [Deltaproteobacteria bacterium]
MHPISTPLRSFLLLLCIASAAIFAASSLTACGGDDEEVSEEEAVALCEDFADIYCEKLFGSCASTTGCPIQAGLFQSESACKVILKDGCTPEGETTGEGTAEPTSEPPTEAEIRACLDAVKSLDCASFCIGDFPSECDKLLTTG